PWSWPRQRVVKEKRPPSGEGGGGRLQATAPNVVPREETPRNETSQGEVNEGETSREGEGIGRGAERLWGKGRTRGRRPGEGGANRLPPSTVDEREGMAGRGGENVAGDLP
ncbi:MAG: hypothetical protein ACK5TO_09430, partial [Planctomycetaceae bacterium]